MTTIARPRVLFVVPVPDFKGGAEVVLRDMWRNPGIVPLIAVPAEGEVAAAARAEGINVAIVRYGAVECIHRPLRLRVLLAAARDWFLAARQLQSLARATGADVLHSNGLKAHAVAVLARILGSPPVVAHLHDLPVYAAEAIVWRAIALGASRTIVVSRACWPGKRLGRTVAVVHNGFVSDGALLSPRPGGAAVTIGFCGRLHPFKGLHLLPEWLAAARAAGIDATLVIRGEAGPADQDYVAALHARFASLGLGDCVRFEGRCNGLAAIYAGLDAVVVPSDTPDPLPRSVMEAMGLGIAVIGFPAGGIPEMIRNGVNGWLADGAQSFVAALRVIAERGEPLRAIRARATETIAHEFSMGRMYERLLAQYALAIRTQWRQDLFANASRSGLKGAAIGWFMNPGFAVVTLHRLTAWGHWRGGTVGALASALGRRTLAKSYGCYIAPSAQIGPALRLPHPIGIVVGEGTVIGADTTIYQHVTFGRRNAADDRYPTVGNAVTIYAGATLVGGIHIGTGAVIGAHALVLSDVPAQARVLAAPARIVAAGADTEVH